MIHGMRSGEESNGIRMARRGAILLLACGFWPGCANSGNGSDSTEGTVDSEAPVVDSAASSGSSAASSVSSGVPFGTAGLPESSGTAAATSTGSSSGTTEATSDDSSDASTGGSEADVPVLPIGYDAPTDYVESCGTCDSGWKCVTTIFGSTCVEPCPGNGQCPSSNPVHYCDKAGGLHCETS